MADTKKQNNNSDKANFENSKKKVEFLKRKYNEDHPEYKAAKKELDNKVSLKVYNYQKQKEKELNSALKKAEDDDNYDLANQIYDKLEAFNENKVDFTKFKREKELQSPMNMMKETSKPFRRTGEKRFDVDYEQLYNIYENIINQEQETFDETTTPTDSTTTSTDSTTTPTGGGGVQKTNEEVNVYDLPETNEEVEVNDLPKTPEEQLIQAQQELEAIQSAESFVPEEYDDTYLPDQQDDRDLLGTALDVGRGVAGAIGASEELPEYAMSPEQRLAIDEATARRNIGLSPDELALIERGQEEAYGYGLKNIEKASGGSAGTYLGNVGAEQSRLYAQKARTAALDQSMRRQNLANFQNMAGVSENINRQIFLDDLRQAERTKMAGAQTLADSISNIKEREQFQKAYGKGSQFYALQKAITQNMQRSDVDARNAAGLRLFNQKQDELNKVNTLKNNIEELQKKTGKNLLGNNSGSNNTFTPLNLSNPNQATSKKIVNIDENKNKEIDTRSLNSKNIDTKIEELRKQMNDTDDMDLSMKLDSEINQLQNQRRKGTNTRKSLFANK